MKSLLLNIPSKSPFALQMCPMHMSAYVWKTSFSSQLLSFVPASQHLKWGLQTRFEMWPDGNAVARTEWETQEGG